MLDPLPVLVVTVGLVVSDGAPRPPIVRPSTAPISDEPEDLRSLILDGFRRVGSDVSDLARDFRDMRREQRETNDRLTKLEAEVFGSSPPPAPAAPVEGAPPVPPAPKLPALRARTSATELQADRLETEVLKLSGAVSELRALNVQQNKAHGVAPEGSNARDKAVAFVFSRAGVNAAVRLVTAIGVMLTAAQMVPACGGHPPRSPVDVPAAGR